MALYLETEGVFTRYTGGPANGIQPPANVGGVWDDEELAAVGLYNPAEADAVPEGKIVVSTVVDRVEGVVKFVHTLEDAPAPDPADFPLTMRQLRLGLLANGFGVGFIQDTIDAIEDPTEQAVALIWYEETSIVEWSHVMTQGLIAAAGLTTEQAGAMWLAARDIPA